jgi:antitoxin (DNA-binding transcriptional repressor) of toxin-antitoxin stability system
MIEIKVADAQRSLAELAAKALEGEEIVITVGKDKLRLARAETNGAGTQTGRRPGRGAWKGRVIIPPDFYAPWSDDEMGERDS